jgi:V8-like Glu-specific endopeptidase
MAQHRQPNDAPLLFDDVRRLVEPRDALQRGPAQQVELSMTVAGESELNVEVAAERLENARSAPEGMGVYQLNLSVYGAAVGTHAFPPTIETVVLSSQRELRTQPEEVLEGYLPDHLALHPMPEPLPNELRTKPRLLSIHKQLDENLYEATTVFAPDDRYTFSDTAFPWSTVGRVDSPNGTSSGTMVGPRHLLTASHAIAWNSDGTAGWVKFTPSYFDGSEPYGVAWAQTTYFEVKVDPPVVTGDETRHDYVVCVLDRRIGDLTGWMGYRTYSDSWDGGTYWAHVGYPGDLTGASRPTFQGNIALDASEADPEEHQAIFHQGDVWPGQSGGPFFAWWDGESWPDLVSVQSWQATDNNGASGGSHMVDLIIQAKSDFP